MRSNSLFSNNNQKSNSNDPNLKDQNGNNALHLALQQKTISVNNVLELIPKINDIHAQNNDGLSALRLIMDRTAEQTTVLQEYDPIFLKLLEYGSDLNTRDANQNSLLHLAVSKTLIIQNDYINDLLKKGLDPELKNNENLTAFQLLLKGIVTSNAAAAAIALIKNSKDVKDNATAFLKHYLQKHYLYTVAKPPITFHDCVKTLLALDADASIIEHDLKYIDRELIFLLLIYGANFPLASIIMNLITSDNLRLAKSNEKNDIPALSREYTLPLYIQALTELKAFLSLGSTLTIFSNGWSSIIHTVNIVNFLFEHAKFGDLHYELLDCALDSIKYKFTAESKFLNQNILELLYERYPEIKNYVRKYFNHDADITDTEKVFARIDINDLRLELKLSQAKTKRSEFLRFLFMLSKFFASDAQQKIHSPFNKLPLDLIFVIISFFDFKGMERTEEAGLALAKFIFTNVPLNQDSKIDGLSVRQTSNENKTYTFSFFYSSEPSFIKKSERIRRQYIQLEDETSDKELIQKHAKNIVKNDLKSFTGEPISSGIQKFSFIGSIEGKLFNKDLIDSVKQEVIEEIKNENRKILNNP